MSQRPTITADRLRELLNYDPASGEFKWRIDRRMGRTGKGALRAAAGSPAGKIDPTTGYLQVNIGGRRYLMHRLAVLHVTGEWPQYEVDHLDGDRANNAWANLRDATHRVNTQNLRKARADNKLGIQGVQRAAGGRYVARIRCNGSQRYLGRFDDAAAAHQAYLTAKRGLHEGCTI